MALTLNSLTPARGANRKPKRVGRGIGTGHSKTSTRGYKGQKSRSGSSIRPGFEGGQMPLYRRLPKRGFHNIFRREFTTVNLSQLNVFKSGTTVTPEELIRKGIIHKVNEGGLKVLAEGDLKSVLIIRAHKFSAAALAKIKAAGGTVEVIGGAGSR